MSKKPDDDMLPPPPSVDFMPAPAYGIPPMRDSPRLPEARVMRRRVGLAVAIAAVAIAAAIAVIVLLTT
jgi:hypothetical protein